MFFLSLLIICGTPCANRKVLTEITTMNCEKCFENITKDDCLNCSMCKILFHFYCQGYNKSAFGKMTKNSKSKLVCLDCKVGFESSAPTPTNKQNVTLQSLADSVNFMSNKFDEFNNTVTKLLKEMKELQEENRKIANINTSCKLVQVSQSYKAILHTYIFKNLFLTSNSTLLVINRCFFTLESPLCLCYST